MSLMFVTPMINPMIKRNLILFALLLGVCLTFIKLTSPGRVQASANKAASKRQADAQPAQKERVTLRADGRGNPWINLRDGRDVPTSFEGAAELEEMMEQNQAQPLALAAGDFDEDGVPDLVGGYAGPAGGVLTLHRGNVDSIYPNSPEAKQRQLKGEFTDAPFLSPALVFAVHEAPDFLGTGDFDADGHWDVVVAARGSNVLYFLPGNRRGKFGTAQRVNLPGRVTALITGEVNRADGLTDVVIGIVGPNGSKVLILESPEGALKGEPEVFNLPAQATALALWQHGEDYFTDVAVAAGAEMLIVHGRDRKLSLDMERRASVPAAHVNQQRFNVDIKAMAAGDFIGRGTKDLAVLTADGSVQVWRADGDRLMSASMPLRVSNSTQAMLTARVSSHASDTLVLLDADEKQIQLITNNVGQQEPGVAVADVAPSDAVLQTAARLDVTAGGPVASLPMRLNADALADLVVLAQGATAPSVVPTAATGLFVVNSTGDGQDANLMDGLCADSGGQCTLRAAIMQGNHDGGVTIGFNIGSGVKTIPILSPLPTVTVSATIDGTTQPGFNGAPVIEVKGQAYDGLVLAGGNSTVRGLVLNGFVESQATHAALTLQGGGNIIEGNYIGTNVAGDAPAKNNEGIRIPSGGNIIGGTTAQARNVIAGNDGTALRIGGVVSQNPPGGNRVIGNYIGTNAAGTAALNNGLNQIGVEVGLNNNHIGEPTAGARNVISGFGDCVHIGINSSMQGPPAQPVEPSMNLVQNNYIGTDVNGAASIGNGKTGVFLIGLGFTGPGPRNNTIGGTATSARNIISVTAGGAGGEISLGVAFDTLIQGNYLGLNANGTSAIATGLDFGVQVTNNQSNTSVGGAVAGAGNVIAGDLGSNPGTGVVMDSGTGSIVQGNFIGTNANGSVALPFIDGITATQSGAVIGGSGAARNLISGNTGIGIHINTSGVIVRGNLIGTKADGVSPLGNGGDGIRINGSNVVIGGPNAGEGNIIAHNGTGPTRGDGVNVITSTSANNLIRFNSIYDNGGLANNNLGIDLAPDGVNANDSCDGDSGANQGQNYPVLNSVSFSNGGGGAIISGTLNSTANTTIDIDLYASSTCHSSGFGEGQNYLGTRTVTIDSSCNVSFTFPISSSPGGTITATATDANNNTSEFSRCLSMPSVVAFGGSGTSVNEGAGSVTIPVFRTGDTSITSTVDFATADGTAKQSKDYIISSGILTFGPGVSGRSITVLVTDNAYVDGTRTFNIVLSSPSGATLNTPSTTTVTIQDNDTSPPTTNPLDNADQQFFVLQHYYDFLSRAPDQGGFDFWVSQITQCGSDPICIRNKRVDVSNAFFYELEFQQTGSYVYRLYRAAFGNNQPFPNPNPDPAHPGEEKRVPLYLPFMKDRARVPGGAQLPQFQLDLANGFVQRPEFVAKYPANLDGPSFVDALLATIQNDIGVNLTSQRPALIALFNSGGRGAVIYRLADDNAQSNPIDNRAFIDAEYNRAFVFTQYAGYLRRNPDMAGFLFWLGQVNSVPLRDVPKQHAMVCSFITSAEYQQRFSSMVTHFNSECPQ